MKTLSELDDLSLIAAIDNRWRDSDTLWQKAKMWGNVNREYWRNAWEDQIRSAKKLSKVKDNRIFLSVEHDVNILTARPAKPIVLPARENDEQSRLVAEALQHQFLELYRKRRVKKKLKRGIRFVHFDRLICLYPFWNAEINDVDVRVVNPKNIRLPKNSNSPEEAAWSIEEVKEPLMALLSKSTEDEEKAIKDTLKIQDDMLVKNNPDVVYRMFWTKEELVCYLPHSKKIFKRIKILPGIGRDWL